MAPLVPAPDAVDGAPVRVLIRPEQILLRPVDGAAPDRSGAWSSVEGRPAPVAVVRAVDFYGHDADVELELVGSLARLAGAVGLPGGPDHEPEPGPPGAPDAVRLRARTAADALPERGALVRLEVTGPAVVFPAVGAEGRIA
jgi:hypothetical protein